MGIGIRVVIEEKENLAIIRIEGRIDATSTPVLEGKIRPSLEKATRVLMDFSDVDYLSSAGMRLLLAASKKLKAKQGHLVFCCMDDDVMEIIKMAGFDKILSIYKTEEEALKALH